MIFSGFIFNPKIMSAPALSWSQELRLRFKITTKSSYGRKNIDVPRQTTSTPWQVNLAKGSVPCLEDFSNGLTMRGPSQEVDDR